MDKRPLFEIYTNREFLEKVVHDSDDEIHVDFLNNFLLRYAHAQMFVDGFDNIEDYQEFLLQKKILNEVFNTGKLGGFVSKLQDDQFYNSGNGFKLFLLENVDTEALQHKFGFLFIDSKSISVKWAYHLTTKERWFVTANNRSDGEDAGRYFKDWSQLGSCIGNAGSSLVLFDKYIANDKNNQKLRDNLYPLLLHVLKNTKSSSSIEILLICESLYGKKIDFLDAEDFNKLRTEIDAFLKRNGLPHIGVKILIYPDQGHIGGLDQKDKEHDRFFFTNYFFVKRGAGFNIFRNNGSFEHLSPIEIFSLLDYRKIPLITSSIRNIGKYAQSVMNLAPEQRRSAVRGPVIERVFSDTSIVNRLIC